MNPCHSDLNRIGHVSKVCTIPFDCGLNSTEPIAMMCNPANKDQLFMLLYDKKSSQIKLITYSLKNNQFQEIQHIDDHQFNIFSVDIKIPNRKSIIEQHLTKSKITYKYTHIEKNSYNPYPSNNNTSFQLLDFSSIKRDCILVVVNCHQPKTWTSYITTKDDSCVYQWFGIFNCKSMKFEHCTIIHSSKKSRGHYCYLYKNWLFVANSSGKYTMSIDHIDELHIFRLILKYNYLPTKKKHLYDQIDVSKSNIDSYDRDGNRIYLTTIYGCVVVEKENMQMHVAQTMIHNFTIPSFIFYDTVICLIFYGGDGQHKFCVMLNIELKIPAAVPYNYDHNHVGIGTYHCNYYFQYDFKPSKLGLHYDVQYKKYPENDYRCNLVFDTITKWNNLIPNVNNSNCQVLWYRYEHFVHLYLPKQNMILFIGGNTWIPVFTPFDIVDDDMLRIFDTVGHEKAARLRNIIWFDCKHQLWDVGIYMIDKNLTCGDPDSDLLPAVNMVRVEDNGYCIVYKKVGEANKASHELQLYSVVLSNDRLRWSVQRLIWIAYYRNKATKKCYFRLLPKDLIKLIITFVDPFFVS